MAEYVESFIPFVRGVEQTKSEIQSDGPYDIQNMQWDKATSLSQRSGFSSTIFSPSSIVSGTSGLSSSLSPLSQGGLGPIIDVGARTNKEGTAQLVVVTSGSLLSVSEEFGIATRVAHNKRAKSSISPMVDGANSKNSAVSACGDGLRVVAWLENVSGSLTGDIDYYHTKMVVIDEARDAIISGPATISQTPQPFTDALTSESVTGSLGPVGPRVLFSSGVFSTLYFENNDSSLRARQVVHTSPNVISNAITIISGGTFVGGLFGHYDAQVWQGNPSTLSDIIMVASLTGTPSTLTMKYLNSTSLTQLSNLSWAAPAVDVFACGTDGRRPYVLSLGPGTASFTSGNLHISSSCGVGTGAATFSASTVVDTFLDYSSSLMTVAAVGRVYSAHQGPQSSGVEWLMCYRPLYVASGDASTDKNRLFSNVKRAVVSGSTIVSSSQTIFKHACLASHGYKNSVDNSWMVDVISQDNLQNIGFTVTLSQSHGDGALLSSQMPYSVWGRDLVNAPFFTVPRVTSQDDRLPAGNTNSARRWQHPVSTRGRFNQIADDAPSFKGRWSQGLSLIRHDFDPPTQPMLRSDDLLLRPGGILRAFDGLTDAPLGFHMTPSLHDKPTGTPFDYFPSFQFITSSGGLTAGTRRYTVLPKWIDNGGREHAGVFCVPATLVNTSSTNVKINIPTLPFDPRQDIRFEIYRTQTSGSTFHLISSGSQVIRNDASVDYVSFVDSLSDNELTAREQLPIQETPTLGTLGSSLVAEWQDRLVAVDDYDGLTLIYSKPIVERDEMPKLGDRLRLSIPSEGGRITGLAVMDTTLVVFKDDKTFVVAGILADTSGQGANFAIQPLPSDVGCINARSILVLPQGVAFQSRYGLQLLDRSFSISNLGDNVIDIINDTVIVAANVLEQERQARWVLSDGRQLVLDVPSVRWTTFLHAPIILSGTLGANYGLTAGTVVDGIQCISSHIGVFSGTRDNNDIADAGSAPGWKIETPWVSTGGREGHQKFRHVTLQGVCHSSFTASMRFDYDNIKQTTAGASGSYVVTQSSAEVIQDTNDDGSSKLVWRHALQRGRCESIKVTISAISSSMPLTRSFDAEGLRVRFFAANDETTTHLKGSRKA